jgi:signal peptidase I
MEPTFHDGDRLLFARLPWEQGDVVLAEVGEEDPVIKRVTEVSSEGIHLTGDNQEVTESYDTVPRAVEGVYVVRLRAGSGRVARAATVD